MAITNPVLLSALPGWGVGGVGGVGGAGGTPDFK